MRVDFRRKGLSVILGFAEITDGLAAARRRRLRSFMIENIQALPAVTVIQLLALKIGARIF